MSRGQLFFIAAVAVGVVFFSALGILMMQSGTNVSQSDARLASLLGIELGAAREWQAANGLNENIGFGSLGKDVVIVQNALLDLGFMDSSSSVTGFYGPITFAAVKDFQGENNLPTTGFVGSQTRNVLNDLYFKTLCPTPSKTYPDFSFLDVSKSTGLPEGYAPPRLVSLSDYQVKTLGVICLKEEAAVSLAQMFHDAAAEGIDLAVTSGFRSYDVQGLLYSYWYKLKGAEALNEIAPPGNSEHQLGTAVDLTGASAHFLGVDKNFGDSPEGKWLKANSYRYGFVLSYSDNDPSGDYIFEPWHYRFVGTEIADNVHNSSGTLEEYLKVFNEYASSSTDSGSAEQGVPPIVPLNERSHPAG